jgi:hypothetical protein
LATQGYIIQSYATIRPILESIDLIKLFQKSPEYAGLWVSGGEVARKELKPSKVRKKLGKESVDEVYAHFCVHGTHPTFEGGSNMTAMKIGAGKPKVTIWIGGIHNEYALPRLLFLFGFIYLLQIMTLLELAKLSADLNKSDNSEVLIECMDNFLEFTKLEEAELNLKDNPEYEQISQFLSEMIASLRKK